jgi:hypothetical protein
VAKIKNTGTSLAKHVMSATKDLAGVGLKLIHNSVLCLERVWLFVEFSLKLVDLQTM